MYFYILCPSLGFLSLSAIIHIGIVNTYATNTIEVHGFWQRLQDSLLHMLSVSDLWVVFVLTLVLFRFIGFGESGQASGQVARPCPEDMPTDQVKD